jgi:hypothetical protein
MKVLEESEVLPKHGIHMMRVVRSINSKLPGKHTFVVKDGLKLVNRSLVAGDSHAARTIDASNIRPNVAQTVDEVLSLVSRQSHRHHGANTRIRHIFESRRSNTAVICDS